MGFWHVYMGIYGGGGEAVAPSFHAAWATGANVVIARGTQC